MSASSRMTCTDLDRLQLMTAYLQHTLPSGQSKPRKLIHLFTHQIYLVMILEENEVFKYKGMRRKTEVIDSFFSPDKQISIVALKIISGEETSLIHVTSIEDSSAHITDKLLFEFAVKKGILKICSVIHTRNSSLHTPEPSLEDSSTNINKDSITEKEAIEFIKKKQHSSGLPVRYSHLFPIFNYCTEYLSNNMTNLSQLLPTDFKLTLTPCLKIGVPSEVISTNTSIKEGLDRLRSDVKEYFQPDAAIKNIQISFYHANSCDPIMLHLECKRVVTGGEFITDSQLMLFSWLPDKESCDLDRITHIQYVPFKKSDKAPGCILS